MELDFSPIWISLQTALVTIVIVFFLGIILAWEVLRCKNEVTRIVLDGIITMPLVLPPTVAGFFLLVIFGNNGPIGKFFLEAFGVQIAFSWLATVVAATVIALPLMYRSARGAFEQVDVGLIDAGRSLALSELTIFFRILVPCALPGLISGGVLAFARALGEFGATAMLAGNIAGKTRTLSLAVYSEVAGGDMDAAGFYVSVILVVCFIIIVGLNWYLYACKKRQTGNNLYRY